ncbi:MAG: hypothetical protein ABII00_03225 [Elusimicrobiota bacterium]
MTTEGGGRVSRKGFLARLAAGAAALLGGVHFGRAGREHDRDLREADFYSPHDLAG